jgi:hypothetical protein
MISGRLIERLVFADANADKAALRFKVRALAGASLFFWVCAITAGRLTAYLFANPSVSASLH